MSMNNISFLLEEKDTNLDEEESNLNKLSNFYQLDLNDVNQVNVNHVNELLYYVEKSVFVNEDEIYYNEKYTIKDLMKICVYYGIDKNIKASKCKKQDIISTIVFFEGQVENSGIVFKRHNMWAYMKELMSDTKMRMYLLWS